MADEWSAFPITSTSPPAHSGWDAFPTATASTAPAKPPADKYSTVGSFLRHGVHGLTAGFSDELSGLMASSGYAEAMPYLDNPDPAAVPKIYTEQRDASRKALEESKAEHPYASGAGDLAGSVVGMAAMPAGEIAQGARLLPRIGQAIKSGAQVGAEYGALSGAGEGKDATDRITGALTGGLSGGVGGAAGGAGGELIGAGGKLAYDYFGKPIASVIRGLRDPEQEAMRRGAGAIMQGQGNIAAGKSLGMTPHEWLAAKQAGEPVMLADLGGETGRALARSAANTDPEARAVISTAAQDRFEGQNERAGQLIRGLVHGGADAFKRSEQLLTDYNAGRKPLYDAAYNAGDRPIWSPELERLASIPAVEGALKSAVTTGANRAGAEGYGGFNPGVTVTPDGRLLFNKGKNGIPTYPNLQFWDYAYRDLRDKAGAAFRSGEKDHGSALNTVANNMRSELDNMVPEYGRARGFAAKYFGGENALEAGANAVKFKGDWRELQQTVAKIKDPRERDLFTEGYVSELAHRMENVADRNEITKRIFQSPQDRKRIEAVIGPGRTRALQGFLDRETIYDSLRTALGNSTTARQLIEAGLAGGAIGGYLGQGNPLSMMEGIAAGATGGAGIGKMAGHGVSSITRAGAQKLIGYVDRNTARKVADFLTSDDPHTLLQGLRLVQNNPKIAAGMRDITDRVSIAAAAKNTPVLPIPHITVHPLPGMSGVQGPGTANADEQNIPRPPAQQKHGGAVQQKPGFAHGGRTSSAHDKQTHAAVQYQLPSKHVGQHCSGCAMFVSGTIPDCTAVKRPIWPRGWCNRFEPRRKA